MPDILLEQINKDKRMLQDLPKKTAINSTGKLDRVSI